MHPSRPHSRRPSKRTGYTLGVATALVSWWLAASPARACSVCGCGDPLVAAGDSRPMAGGLRLALEGDYLTAEARSDDDPAATESLIQSTLRPVIVYSPQETLNLVLQVPLIRKDWALNGGAEGLVTASNSGVGDIDLGARWFLWQSSNLRKDRRQGFALTAGASLPTGRNDLQAAGQRLDEHAQLGAGALGPYAGALYAFHQDPWNLTLNAAARVHTVNGYGYQYGTALLWSARGTYRLWDRVALVLGVDGRYAGRDVDFSGGAPGALQENTGGLVLDAVPGVSVNLVENLWLHVWAQLPFFTHLFGDQRVGPEVTASLQYSFGS